MYSNEEFKTYVMLADDGIIRVDSNCVIRFANPCMLRMLGLGSREELIGKSLAEIVEVSDHGKVIEKFAKRKKGVAESYVLSFVRKEGPTFTGYLSAVPLFEKNAFKGSFAVIKDMTREEQIVKRLRSSEARFRNLARQLPAAICELEPDSTIRYANDFARRFLGIEGWCGRYSLRRFLPSDELPRYDKMVGETFEGVEYEPFPIDFLSAGGERLPTLCSLALVDERGACARASVVIVDIQGIISAAYTYDEHFFEPYGLTEREQSVAKLLIRGSIYKEIAYELGVSLSTVRTHTMSLYRKMGIHSREEIVDLARSWQVERCGKSALIERLGLGFPPPLSAE
jgi:PAS domain S-box-containing protein